MEFEVNLRMTSPVLLMRLQMQLGQVGQVTATWSLVGRQKQSQSIQHSTYQMSTL